MIQTRGPWIFHNNKNSGYVSGEYLVLERDEKHYFRKYGGFAISRDIYEFAESKGLKYYEIHYKPTSEVIVFNIHDFPSGRRIMFGGEIQYILPKGKSVLIFKTESFTPQHMDPNGGHTS